MSESLLTIGARLATNAREFARRPALLAPGSLPLTHSELFDLACRTVDDLRRIGLGPQDRIAVVVSDAACLAAATLGIAAGAVCAPLNPRLADRDWARVLGGFGIAALVVEADIAPSARAAARRLGIRVIDLAPFAGDRAGSFSLLPLEQPSEHAGDDPTLDGDAFVLPTSGTTSTPKCIPLTQRNVAHSARNMATAIRLTERDRLLGILPLHHSYGLISGLVASIAVGASVVCLDAFRTEHFFAACEEFGPTWFMGVPALFQELVSGAPTRPVMGLRLIHSSASPLAPRLIARLEERFGAPVIETYGMTEAASQIASNPLPPGERRLGSVGLPAGPEVRIADPDGAPLPAGEIGELLIRGPNVTRGYEGATIAGEGWTPGGWFRTGDLGYRDPDGYLFLVGRVKEMINRGGEKIAPRKIEEVILEHPEIDEAAAFPLPHPRLGEDVGLAVVPKAGARPRPRDLRLFAALSGGLSESETPRRVAIVEAIPKTASGKVQRLQLARHLGPPGDEGATGGTRGRATGRAHLEWRLAQLWAEALGVDSVGATDDFFDLGGDSLAAVRLALAVVAEFEFEIDFRTILDAPTVTEMAARISVVSPDAPGVAEARLRSDPGICLIVPQERMLACARLFEGLPVYNITSAFRISGPLDAGKLERAINALVDRHEALRTSYRDDGGSVAVHVQPAGACRVAVEAEDWRVVSPHARTRFISEVAQHEAWAKIGLAEAPLFRVRLLRLAEAEFTLILTFHHVITDAWSMDVFLEELSGFYAGAVRDAVASPVEGPKQFSEFVAWQRHCCASDAYGAALSYWAKTLRGAPSLLAPPEGQRTSRPGFLSGRISFALPEPVVDGCRAMARAENTTLYMVLMTGLKVALGTRFGQHDTSVLTPMANRSWRGSGGIIGLLQNQAAIRTRLPEDTSFVDAMRSVRAAVLEAQKHQAIPFECLVDDLQLGPEDSAALMEVSFSLVAGYGRSLRLPELVTAPEAGVRFQGEPALSANRSCLMLTLVDTPAGIAGSCVFKETLFDRASIEDFVSLYLHVLSSAVTRPEESIGRLAAAEPVR